MSSIKIPDAFLSGPSANPQAYRIDFEKTSPPIVAFKNNFAAVIDNFMTETECKELLRLAEESITAPQTDETTKDPSKPAPAPVWERAMVNAGNGKQVMSVDTRKSGRIILDSFDISQRILDRLRPFLRDFGIERVQNQPTVTGLGPARRNEVFAVSSLNERMRFLRYEGGDYFRPHWDGCYVTPDGKERSLFTIHLYLNGEGEQDMEELRPYLKRAEKENRLILGGKLYDEVESKEMLDEQEISSEDSPQVEGSLLGGATSFIDGLGYKDAVRVFPKTGSILIFSQRNLMHCGDDVFRGVKYTVRSDLMYSKED
ncbi:Prolyl 4-hydroxylase alpha subunit [Penicillium argentinense]|uniref:Prolyl 4-hydroxylase alpha subunit n=1 Tax=Penicillium argentinense TaxID=1131581 RepID=A0A9W9EYT6_9EURO|nr:Prolyl 4-hydroxylase alpha subunit [Penicillium argentinense]KAJ5090468.1 Prolyl 4-hydroxylase alpha subunit [Penicillium argentinense]